MIFQVQCDPAQAMEFSNHNDNSAMVKDLLEVICDDPTAAGKHLIILLRVPSPAALSQFQNITSSTANTPAKFALKLLSVFFGDEELGNSNCTFAEGWRLLDQNVLLGIKCKLI